MVDLPALFTDLVRLEIELWNAVEARLRSELDVGLATAQTLQVVAMMGGMGRSIDGGYAEFTCVPVAQALPFRSDLPWTTLGAVPEMLQTAYGALTAGLDVQPGTSRLIRAAPHRWAWRPRFSRSAAA